MQLYAAVEGDTDRFVLQRIVADYGIVLSPDRVFITGGKDRLDRKLRAYNQAARKAPWVVLRDADRLHGGCPVKIRNERFLQTDQSDLMCFRVVVRTLEAWLLADSQAFSTHFAVAHSKIPGQPELLEAPKTALLNLLSVSRSSVIRRRAVVPVPGGYDVGPEYVPIIQKYVTERWAPVRAREAAPSLDRFLLDFVTRFGGIAFEP